VSADPSLVRFRAVVEGALAHLDARRGEINDLNVFPVADGDTGDNMALTLRACLAELDRLAAEDSRLIDEIGREEIVSSVARAALLGARGNSGVILSQLIRGAAEELISRPGELVDPVLVAASVARAAQRAYDSVRTPVEGTMLTVMRDMAASMTRDLAHAGGADARLGPETDVARQNAVIADALERAIVAGEESVRRGPELLPVLREAGVVDAGGYAVTVVFAGVVAALRGDDGPELAHHGRPVVALGAHGEHASETYRYCTNFAVSGERLDDRDWEHELAAFGDSILVVGDDRTVKVHVHTDEPERAFALFSGAGELSHQDVADMHEQVATRRTRLAVPADGAAPRCSVLAVISGDGIAVLFNELGAATLDGGPTFNPSTDEILAAITAQPGDEVVVLANNPNVVMAAEGAAGLSTRPVRVLATGSQQAGLAAAFAAQPDSPADVNAELMDAALAAIRTGGVAPAAREDPSGRFTIGDAVGFVGDELVAWGEPGETLSAILRALGAGTELITCIVGDGAPLHRDAVLALAPDGVEVEVEHGGQPSWWWLLTAE